MPKHDDKPAAHEVQARQELANAEELGNDESARAARKRLEAAGAGRAAAADASADDEHAKRRSAPTGRQAPSKQTS